jgi:MFS transporter, FHS family, Na+ dependent glucose transporter 1
MTSPLAPSTETGNDRKIAKTVGYYLAFIVLGLIMSSLGPTLIGLAAHTRTQISEISFLFTATSLGYLLGSLLGGRIYDRAPGHPLLVVVLLGTAVTMALVPLIPWLWLLMLLMVVLGIGQGFLDVGCNTLLVWVHRDKVAPFMNGLHFFFGVGAFIAPLLSPRRSV